MLKLISVLRERIIVAGRQLYTFVFTDQPEQAFHPSPSTEVRGEEPAEADDIGQRRLRHALRLHGPAHAERMEQDTTELTALSVH